jgi:predicted Zn-dependent protease
MSPRVLLSLFAAIAILGSVVIGFGIPGRLAKLTGGDAGNVGVSTRQGYAADGYNAVMDEAAAAVNRRDFKTAVDLFLQVPAGGDPRAVRARMFAGQFLISELHEPTRGIAVLDELLAQFPEQIEAHALLARTLDACGRQFEADEHRREIVRVEQRERTELFRLAENRVGVGNADMLKKLHEQNPGDINVRLGMAQLDLAAGKLPQAEQALRQIVSEEPELFTAQAALGSALAQQNKLDEYDAWRNELPLDALNSSEIWLVRGQAAEQKQQPEVAARCYVEAVRIDPDDVEANLGAARLLEEIGRGAEAPAFATRGAALAELRELLLTDPELESAQHMTRVAEITEDLGRVWEARAWRFNLLNDDSNNPSNLSEFERLQLTLTPGSAERTVFEANPANHVNVSALPDR